MSGRSLSRRGQVVLAAAAAIAVALSPLVLAYLQLGYHDDIDAAGEFDAPAANAERFLSRAVHAAATDVPETHTWRNRSDAVAAVRSRLAPRLDTLAAARVEAGIAYNITYNRTAATRRAAEQCPRGPARQFGRCEAARGVVVQNRANRTHVLAVALDVTVTTERGRTGMTVVVEPTGDTG
ncbi:hypothetical protein BRC83_09855 [Halobacteriales archaeon QS_1_68_17]|nr:MAG: hypothetical protein BRC83_09855 [Halobacteriales archaeon QS_1_68_17]